MEQKCRRTAESWIAATAVTVCINKVYTPGLPVREWIDVVSWYLLLGARRIVVFESIEPDRPRELSEAEAREKLKRADDLPVSYTHLTLPTSDLV